MVYTSDEAVIHVQFNGRSFDVSLASLDVGSRLSDSDIKRNLARHLEVNVSRLEDYVVDRFHQENAKRWAACYKVRDSNHRTHDEAPGSSRTRPA